MRNSINVHATVLITSLPFKLLAIKNIEVVDSSNERRIDGANLYSRRPIYIPSKTKSVFTKQKSFGGKKQCKDSTHSMCLILITWFHSCCIYKAHSPFFRGISVDVSLNDAPSAVSYHGL